MPDERHIDPADGSGSAADRQRSTELAVFLSTTFILIPGVAVAFVGSYGLIVWISQILLGPPGPPG